jgi:WD40 repeat protein
VSVIEVAIGYGRAPGKFRVEVVRSPAGEATAEADLDVGLLQAGRQQFQQTLLASAVPARQILSPAERAVREAGQLLFAALLGTGQVAGRYEASAALAAERGEELRIVLRIDAPELASLPWEAMYDLGAGGYVCRQHQVVRHVPIAAVPPPLEVRPPLRVLGVISAPRGLAYLDTDREREQLTRALASPDGQAFAEVTWASPTWAGLQEMLLAGPWHVLHFTGHGDFDPLKDEGMLALTREDGRADLVEASRFADLLRQARPMPRLVVLNSCSGAATGAGDLFSGTAAALARSGVAAVAAMQYSISDYAAIAFARGFYAALAHGRGVDEAASAGRIAILGTSSQTLEWITPVLYLRGRDTRLFTIPPISTPPARLRSTQTTQPKVTPAAPAKITLPAAHQRVRADPRPEPASPLSAPATFRLTRVLAGHTDTVETVAFSADGSLLATGSPDTTVLLWDTGTGDPIHTLTGHTDAVESVAFSPDGSKIAAGSLDTTARLWDTRTGDPVRTLTGHTDAVESVAFSPDGSLLASGSFDATVRLWNTSTGSVAHILTGHTAPVYGLAFSPDRGLLASGSFDATVRLWDTSTGSVAHTLTGHTAPVFGLAFSPDGGLLATAGYDKTARIWDTNTGKLRALANHTAPVYRVEFSPDGALLATTGPDSKVQLWDSDTGHPVRALTGHTAPGYGLAFSPDGILVAAIVSDNTAQVWQTATGRTVQILTGHTAPVNALTFSPNGDLLATASLDTTIRLWARGYLP